MVARDREELDGQLRLLDLALLALVAALLAAIAILVPLAVKLGLRPLDGMRRQVAALNAESLDGRIAVRAPPQSSSR